MKDTLHITSGDCAGGILSKTGITGEVFVWHDILYDGPRKPGWPDEVALDARARFLELETAGGLDRAYVLNTLKKQYTKLATAQIYNKIVLWFDACLFDQSMLVHILMCLEACSVRNTELLCVDAYPGIEPFIGLGQLSPEQMASVYDQRRPVTEDQYRFAKMVDAAFAGQDQALFYRLAQQQDSPFPWVPAAVRRWLQEKPDPKTGLGRLEQLALAAVRSGCQSPGEIYSAVARVDTPPQYWGDTTLWAKINALADRNPSLVRIDGPLQRLPQWESDIDINAFKITGD